MRKTTLFLLILLLGAASARAQQKFTSLVNPFMGTATLWEPEDLGYTRNEVKRAWGGETFPGACLPNAMVQATPVTMFHTGSGYQYEDQQIYGFAHTSKGHWNLLHVPVMPVNGVFYPSNFCSRFSHSREQAHPGYYEVYLRRYHVDAELTSTLRCAFHRYTFRKGDDKQLVVDIARNNGNPRRYAVHQSGSNSFEGYQQGEGMIYFYAETSLPVKSLEMVKDHKHRIAVVKFNQTDSSDQLLLRIGFSFTSIENAKLNLQQEIGQKSFDEVRTAADATWEQLLSQIRVSGGTDAQQRMFYSCLYHSLLWPCLRNDVNGEYRDAKGNVVKADFNYYNDPSFWDTYRNKLILLGLLTPKVACDIIRSITDRGEKQGGYMPTFFHGDHASTFVAGMWNRGIRDFDVKRSYQLLLNNAFKPGRGGRRYLDEYIRQGWIAEKDTTDVPTEDEYKGAVTKTVEYAYDDYATALLAKALGDKQNYKKLMARTKNYRNVFDASTGFFRGRIADGSWIKDFDPYYPYYQYMYREANAWQSLFFAPHDPEGLIALYPSQQAVEAKLDSLFTEPWREYEAWNMTGFLGNYCHGNQPDHSVPFTYYYIGKQEKGQVVLNTLLQQYYGMGKEHLAFAGMNDAGEMGAWYVMNALGLYTYSPADAKYLVTVPLFTEVDFTLGTGQTIRIQRNGNGPHITGLRLGNKQLKGYEVQHADLLSGKPLVISCEETSSAKAFEQTLHKLTPAGLRERD